MNKNSTANVPNMSLLVHSTVSPFLSHNNAAFGDELVHYITIVNIVSICTVISVFGMLSNIAHMVIFQRLGLRETVNITLFAIAISDFISTATTLWMAICYNPLFHTLDLPFIPLEVQFPTGDMPHMIAMNVTSWLTAFVTFERCICITFPLTVKEIITPGRTKAIIVFIFIMVVAFQIPTYLMARMAWKFDYGKNQSLIGLVIEEDYVMVNAIAMYIINVFGPFLSFAIIVVCSVILAMKLYQKSQWRHQSLATPRKEEAMEDRDRKVLKLILIVAVIFIVCNSPAMLVFIMTAENPERTPGGSLANNYYVAVSFALVFETVNASVNIFVYYNMSSRYKENFRYIFLRQSADTNRVT